MIRKLVAVRFSAIYFSMLRSSRKKSSVGRHILLALLGIYLACVVVFLTGMMFLAICEPFHSLGLDWLYFGMMVMGAFALMVVGSIFFAQSQLYEAKDNELLLSLPVPVSAILGSRMIMLYLINFVYGTMVMLPGMVVLCNEDIRKRSTDGVFLCNMAAFAFAGVKRFLSDRCFTCTD